MKKTLLTSLSIFALSSPVLWPAFAATDGKPHTTAPAVKDSALQENVDLTIAKNEAEYRSHLIALGSIALKASEIAADKADNDKVEEFAEFEVSEQKAISAVLKEMKTKSPATPPDDQAVLDKLKSESNNFDKAYLQASLDIHEKLQSLTENYLKTKASNAEEQHAHHLAMVTLPTIKQHIAQSKELLDILK